MTAPTLEDVLRLVEQLSPDDQRRLQTVLTTAAESVRAAQQQRNQAAMDLLDAWAADAEDTDDTWWSAFAHDLDAHRTSDRPLYQETAEWNNPIDAIAMKRRIQEQIYEETKHLAPEEFIAYMRQRMANSQFADFLNRADAPQPQGDPSKMAR